MKKNTPQVHGAWLGAGTGGFVANLIVQALQTDVLHRTLSQPATTLIYGVVTAAVAYLGARLAPPVRPQTVAVRYPVPSLVPPSHELRFPGELTPEAYEKAKQDFLEAAASGKPTVLSDDPEPLPYLQGDQAAQSWPTGRGPDG